jgi:hypothetical protein
MATHQAIETAVKAALAEATDQTEEFKREFAKLVALVLDGNYEDSDVRSVMERAHVTPRAEE